MTQQTSTKHVSNDEGLDENETEFENNKKANSEILLDVGGIKFKTTALTISRHPTSVLHKMFEGRFSLKPNKDGYFFIDRDGSHFRYILNYLRDGTLILPQNDAQYVINVLLAECNFYQLPSLRKQLLFARSGTKILNPSNMEQISRWMHAEYPNKHKSDWHLLPSTNGVYQTSDLFGIDSLLFVFVAHNMRFGFYLHSVYGEFLPDPSTNEDEWYPEASSQMMIDLADDEYLEWLQSGQDREFPEYNAMSSVTNRGKKGFIFWLDPMYPPSKETTQVTPQNKSYFQSKYKCYFQGITIDHKGEKMPEGIQVIFSVGGMRQEISTDLTQVKGVREYEFDQDHWYEFGKEFYQKNHKIQRMEVFHFGV